MEPRYNEGAKGLAKFVRYTEVLFQILDYYWGKEDPSLYRGLRHIEVRYIEVPLYEYNRPVSSCPKARLSARLFKC